ncbi:MAG TPA: hypothetical protein VE077_00140 [Candidatus Methylomirabilis sp.]|nr:hypothetical protein [Candidatus Methylomirabilis sp.]
MNAENGTMLLPFSSTLIGTLLIALAFCAFAIFAPRTAKIIFRRAEQFFARLAERKTLAILGIFFAVASIRLLVLPFLPVPVPGIHDEFSYLLMADTFVHGRLANPPHPMWMSFETFHVNWFPTYSSMYPPAQGFVLALGQILGHPWIGVLLSASVMSAAILWMLQAWMPSRWALLGAAMVAVKFGIASYWMNSYWGGAVAATGGALVLGALPRITRRAKIRDTLVLGLGIAILANSRPYEGLLLCIPSALFLFRWLAGRANPNSNLRHRLRTVLYPLAAMLILLAAFMGYYNWRLTRNPLLFPHTLNVRTYHTAPIFVWGHVQPPLQYNNQEFVDLYTDWEHEEYPGTFAGFKSASWLKVTRYSTTFLWMGLLLALPGLPFALRDREIRLLVITFFLVLAGLFTVTWSNSHYAAPLTCVIFALLVQSIRHLRTMHIAGRPIGIALSWAIIALLAMDTATAVKHRSCDPLWWTCHGDSSRAAIQRALENTPGKHLVIVRYEQGHNVHDEWVFNGAEIDTAKVLWARELSSEQNEKLFAYFKDRQIWLISPDTDNTELLPYPLADAPPDR